ncbi:MAG: hypothetical protein K5770_11890 [Lachnospiraceae bacterium]|nr:hypothetical protein [Lachnospiraceae bacterium]
MKKNIIIFAFGIISVSFVTGCQGINISMHSDNPGIYVHSPKVSDHEAVAEEDDREDTKDTEDKEEPSGEEITEPVSYQDLMGANSLDSIFSRHGSISVTATVAEDENAGPKSVAYGCNGFRAYIGPDFTYYSIDYRGFGLGYDFRDVLYKEASEGAWRSRNENGEEVTYMDYYAVSDEEKSEYLPDRNEYSVLTDYSEMGEKIVSEYDNEDGTLTVVTEAGTGIYLDEGSMPEGWKDRTMETRYTVDAETFEVTGITVTVLCDGEKEDYMDQKVSYDEEEPEDSISLRAFNTEMRTKEPETPGILAVIYDPGTQEEQIFTKTVDTSVKLSVYVREGYSITEAPQGTILPGDGAQNADIILYAVRD